jgi:hypothetical protein
MRRIMLANGLKKRTAHSITRAGVPVTKKAVLKALKDGTLYPHCVPRHYGPNTHQEVCDWVGIKPADLLPESS